MVPNQIKKKVWLPLVCTLVEGIYLKLFQLYANATLFAPDLSVHAS